MSLSRFLRRIIPAVALSTTVIATSTGFAVAASTYDAPGVYQPQVSCDPVAKPGVLAFRHLILTKFGGGDLGIVRGCSVGGLSEHKEGRAWDYALNVHKPAQHATARKVIRWLLEPVDGDPFRRAKRLGVMYMIWNQRIWGAYRADEGWRPYTGASEHTDHFHFSFTWNGAEKETSWWTGRVEPVDYGPCVRMEGTLASPWSKPNPTPCPEPLRHPTVDADGTYTAQHGETVRRVGRFFHRAPAEIRRWNGYPATGAVQLSVGEKVRVIPLPQRGFYRVEKGQTVRQIAGYFGVSGDQVRRWSHLPARGSAHIHTGQRLRVVKPGTSYRRAR
jgi:hypothetical protein